ncbi:SOS response-associated peptidase [Wenzhouxiangella sp. AB-CW3]|uniref:SOS response-associated peptidase n=1 Tax=Wenzhouxiangella sp. AB-CW3 TaxID=2771012 RepID=UPI00168B4409|nr:SOS response-associated peptidase [Wenzhouxiangella sp. AB-CW3]QOC22168.1 SOS response-associated peptidase [Wenzhouxiangella sp. AB-CW3]
MCGRGGHEFSWEQVYQYLNIPGQPPAGQFRRLNVAPSTRRGQEVQWTELPAVIEDAEDGRRMVRMVWPLVPGWLKGQLPKFSTANCRSEAGVPFSTTVAGKPAFRTAWKRHQRCLVPFSWFYEWDQRSRPRQPWRVMPVSAPMLVFAGLWDESSPPGGSSFRSFTLVTTEPNDLLRDIGHHRAPVLLAPEQWSAWLTGTAEQAEQLLAPPPEGSLRAHRVTTRVNNPGYQGEELLADADSE